jgi:hypothetical protein
VDVGDLRCNYGAGRGKGVLLLEASPKGPNVSLVKLRSTGTLGVTY